MGVSHWRGSGYTRFAHRACSLGPKGSLIEHLGIYSLSVLILYEESLTRNAIKERLFYIEHFHRQHTSLFRFQHFEYNCTFTALGGGSLYRHFLERSR